MKKLIKSPKYVVTITINAYEETTVAASKVTYPKSISNKHKFSDAELQYYNDFVDSMVAPIYARKFIILDEKQSNKSYAYYIDFYPVDREGHPFEDPVRFLFRIAEHLQKHGEHDQVAGDLIIKSFVIDGKTYESPIALQRVIIDICEHLQDGDFDYVATLRT